MVYDLATKLELRLFLVNLEGKWLAPSSGPNYWSHFDTWWGSSNLFHAALPQYCAWSLFRIVSLTLSLHLLLRSLIAWKELAFGVIWLIVYSHFLVVNLLIHLILRQSLIRWSVHVYNLWSLFNCLIICWASQTLVMRSEIWCLPQLKGGMLRCGGGHYENLFNLNSWLFNYKSSLIIN